MKPESLRLADSLNCVTDDSCGYCQSCVIAAELRRLHALNSELLEALERIGGFTVSQFMGPNDMALECCNVALSAIAKAEGQR
jgi:hypothetical protein